MKQLSLAVLLLVSTLSIVGCGTPNGELSSLSSVRPGRVTEGTLANSTLAQDASLVIRKIAGGNKRVIKFVIQQPVGNPGKKSWREVWVYDPEGERKQFIMTFREDGQGSANFQIQKMSPFRTVPFY